MSDSDPLASENLPAPPPASMDILISMLATQALVSMGKLPIPGAKEQPKPRLDYAKHYIDLLAVIETKTTGLLSENESSILNQSLHQLRMLYVQVSK